VQFIDSEKLATALDAMAIKLSVFSISSDAASMAAQRLRDLHQEVERLTTLRNTAANAANTYRTPRPAPARRAINGVEVERMGESVMHRVRFAESVLDYSVRDWDAVTLYKYILRSFANQLADSLGVLYTYRDAMDEDYRDDTFVIYDLQGERSAPTALAIAAMSFANTANQSYGDSPRDVEHAAAIEYGLPGRYDENGRWICECRSCVEVREGIALPDRPQDRLPQEVQNAIDTLRGTTARSMSSFRQYLEPESERAISASDDAAEAVARWRGADAADIAAIWQPVGQYARRLAEIMEGEMRTMSQPPGPPADPQYAEPESERAISESDENHWRTRGV